MPISGHLSVHLFKDEEDCPCPLSVNDDPVQRLICTELICYLTTLSHELRKPVMIKCFALQDALPSVLGGQKPPGRFFIVFVE